MLKTRTQINNMEITIKSAQGLKLPSSSLFSHRLRPFITLTACTPIINGDKPCQVYTTRIDDHGGVDPTWGDKFHLPLHPNFFYQQRHSFIYLQLYTKRLILGPTHLGWCQIPAGDFLSPGGIVRHLSYRLRDRDGSRGHGVVNVAVKLDGWVSVSKNPTQASNGLPEMGEGGMVMGIPVRMMPPVKGQFGICCKEDNWVVSRP